MDTSGGLSTARNCLRAVIIVGLLFALSAPLTKVAYAGEDTPIPSTETLTEEITPSGVEEPSHSTEALASEELSAPADTVQVNEDGLSQPVDSLGEETENAELSEADANTDEASPVESPEEGIQDETVEGEPDASNTTENIEDTVTAGDGQAQTIATADPAIPEESVSEDNQEPTSDEVKPTLIESDETEAVSETLPVPDPYFYVNGDKHSFLPEGGDCDSAANCQVSSTPIQDALDAVSGGLTPDGNTIFIEGGIYAEDVTINNLSDLTLQGAADNNPSILTGAVSVIDSLNITLRDFIFAEIIQVSSSSDVSIVGTEGDDEIEVAVEGKVENLSVESGAGSDAVTLKMAAQNSAVSVESGTGVDTLTLDFSSGTAKNNIVEYDGGEDYDELEVIGDGKSDGSYTPAANSPDAGTMTSGSNTINFVGIEPTVVTNQASYTFTASGADDDLTIDSPAASQNRISGTSGGTAFEALTFSNITNFTIDLVDSDSDGDDTVILGSDGLVASGLQNFNINTGNSGTDTVNLNGPIDLAGALQVISGTINISSNITSSDITLNARNGVTLTNATIVAKADNTNTFVVNADMDADGSGTYSQDNSSSIDTITASIQKCGWTYCYSVPTAGGNVRITAAEIELNSSIKSINLDLVPSQTSSTIGIGDSATGTFNLNTAELATHINAAGKVSIGQTNGTGQVDIRTAQIWQSYQLKISGGEILIQGELTLKKGLQLISSDKIVDLNDGIDIRANPTIKEPRCNPFEMGFCEYENYSLGLQLSSANGVGTADNPIETLTDTSFLGFPMFLSLSGGAFTSGGLFVTNTGWVFVDTVWHDQNVGPFEIFPGIGLETGIFVNNGDVIIIAASPLRVSKAIRVGAGGDINLTAGNNYASTAANPDNVDLRAEVIIDCQGVQNCRGTVTLNAGEEILGANLVSAPGLILNPCLEGGCSGDDGPFQGTISVGSNSSTGGGSGLADAIAAFFGAADSTTLGDATGSTTPGDLSLPVPAAAPAVLTVAIGEPVSLLATGSTNGIVNLQIPGGNSASFRAGIDATVTMNAGADIVLPDALPPGVDSLDILEIAVDTELSSEELGGILLSFGLPADTPIEELVILQYVEGEGWVEVPFELSPDGLIEGLAETGGVFVLAQRNATASAEANPATGNGSVQASLSGDTNESVTLELSQGNQVTVSGGAGDSVIATAESLENLPGDLPEALSFLNCMSVDVTQGGAGVSILPNGEGIELTFNMPEGVSPEDVTILFWLDMLNGGQGGWQEFTPEITPDGRVTFQTFFSGSFVLANY